MSTKYALRLSMGTVFHDCMSGFQNYKPEVLNLFNILGFFFFLRFLFWDSLLFHSSHMYMCIINCYDKISSGFFFPLDVVKTDCLMTLLPLTSESLPLPTLKIRQAHSSQIKGPLLCTLGTVVLEIHFHFNKVISNSLEQCKHASLPPEFFITSQK